MYRPQFPICDAPEGFAWSPVVYSFDQSNTPALFLTIAVGEQTQDIPLVLDTDSDFYWCATRLVSDFELILKDPYTAPLMNDFVAAGLVADQTQPTALEPPGLHCPAGGAILVSFRRVV